MKKKMRLRYVLPGLLVVGAALVGLLTTGASATGTPSSTNTGSSQGGPGSSTNYGVAGTATSSARSSSPISYSLPPAKGIGAGQQLFQLYCSSCHGSNAYGTDRAPNLVGLGAATVDFWVSTGRMPLAISAQQAVRKPPRFTRQETLDIVSYVTSLSPVNGPAIPKVDTSRADLAVGNTLFVLNCAACHTITGAGDAIADGYFAPSLHKATTTQVAEAMRTGPGNMPRFVPGVLTDQQVTDIVAYVTGSLQHPNDRGGLGLGGIGPVAEGFIALLVGVGGLMLVAFWIGDRA
ncbi:MAG: cytochrome bc1 complex diheme cytochrome c subunit [Acidimicrobiales bacterium]